MSTAGRDDIRNLKRLVAELAKRVKSLPVRIGDVGGGGGSGGNADLLFGATTGPVSAAEDWTTFGDGEVQPLDDAGAPNGEPIPLKNRLYESISAANYPVWYVMKGSTAYLVRPGCSPGSGAP
jgi:hypothetical protein